MRGMVIGGYGLPEEVVIHLRKIGATSAYTTQRNNANKRGIPWQMTFAEWWGVWERSGKFHLRGRHLGGWVMARHGDLGPYSVENVAICTHSENAKTAQSHASRRAATATIKHTKRRHKDTPWVVTFRRQWMGRFATEAEAVTKKNELERDNEAHP